MVSDNYLFDLVSIIAERYEDLDSADLADDDDFLDLMDHLRDRYEWLEHLIPHGASGAALFQIAKDMVSLA